MYKWRKDALAKAVVQVQRINALEVFACSKGGTEFC